METSRSWSDETEALLRLPPDAFFKTSTAKKRRRFRPRKLEESLSSDDSVLREVDAFLAKTQCEPREPHEPHEPLGVDELIAKYMYLETEHEEPKPEITAEKPTPNRSLSPAGSARNSSRNRPSSSLHRLWSRTLETDPANRSVDSKVYEEEKLRRRHCETVIERLQKKVLEQQQKSAVAQKADSLKEDRILKLRTVCTDLLDRQRSYEKDSNAKIESLTLQLEEARRNDALLRREKEESDAKLATIALQIDEYEEKIKRFDVLVEEVKRESKKDVEESRAAMNEKENRITELKETNCLIVQLNKQLTENLTLAETSLSKVNGSEVKFNQQLADWKRLKDSLENEIAALKNEKRDLMTKVREEKNIVKDISEQNSKLEETVERAYRTIELLKSEYENFKTAVQSQKNEIKNFYQKQVEAIVSRKVDEFQKQLENTKNSLEIELKKNEDQIALQFAKHLQKIERFHQHDIRCVEDKHYEQISIYKNQLAKCNQTIKQLEEKLSLMKNEHSKMATQLHNAVDIQMQQALRIISNGNSLKNTEKDVSPKSNAANLVEIRKENFQSIDDVSDVAPKNQPSKLTNDKLQHYVKLLLERNPGISDTTNIAQPVMEQKSSIIDFNTNINKQEFKQLAVEKSNENTDYRSEKYFKPPWK